MHVPFLSKPKTGLTGCKRHKSVKDVGRLGRHASKRLADRNHLRERIENIEFTPHTLAEVRRRTDAQLGIIALARAHVLHDAWRAEDIVVCAMQLSNQIIRLLLFHSHRIRVTECFSHFTIEHSVIATDP